MEGKPPKAPSRRWKRLALFLSALVLSTLGLAPAALAQESTGGKRILSCLIWDRSASTGSQVSSSWRWD